MTWIHTNDRKRRLTSKRYAHLTTSEKSKCIVRKYKQWRPTGLGSEPKRNNMLNICSNEVGTSKTENRGIVWMINRVMEEIVRQSTRWQIIGAW